MELNLLGTLSLTVRSSPRNLAAALEIERNKGRARTGNRLDDYPITSPLRSRWQAHGELRIAVLTSGPRHELLLNVELVLRINCQKQQLQTGLQLLLIKPHSSRRRPVG